VEAIGVERAWQAIEAAGAALIVESAVESGAREELPLERFPAGVPRARVINKIDLADGAPASRARAGETELRVSAKTGEGIDRLRAWLLETAGWKPHGEGLFMARERHLRALEEARDHLQNAGNVSQAIDLMAEELRQI